MVRTAFTFDDDKQLVQLACSYVDGGRRIPWAEIAQRMQRTGHTAQALQQRLRTLMRTWGNDVRHFPWNFFTAVQRPRGRPPAVTRQLQALAAAPPPTSNPPSPAASSVSTSSVQGILALAQQAPAVAAAPPAASNPPIPPVSSVSTSPVPGIPAVTQQAPAAAAAPPPPSNSPSRPESLVTVCSVQTTQHAQPDSAVQIDDHPSTTAAVAGLLAVARSSSYAQSPEQQSSPDLDAAAEAASGASYNSADDDEFEEPPESPRSPPMSPRSSEQAVAAIFANVPREVVTQDQNKPYLNVGELMPAGITTLLGELGTIDECDLFLDIGSGVGNVVAQVALETGVYKAIGIEVRCDVHDIGVQMMENSAHRAPFRERTQLVCADVANLHIGYTPPYANVTIVYWNNFLFESQVVEQVKDHLCGMTLLRFVVSCLKFCPRHRGGCGNAFCGAFVLVKEVELPCSWKASLQQYFVCKSTTVE